MSALDDILADLEFLEDPMERLRYIIDLGKGLAPMPPEQRRDELLVRGCASQVWLLPSVGEGEPPRLEFLADADAQIVRGLLALLLALFSGRTAREILSVDVEVLMGRLGFLDQLTPGRQNGLHAMVGRIRAFAEQHVR